MIYNPKEDINNAAHPIRQTAIHILEELATMVGNEAIFDCKKRNKMLWYQCEDFIVTEIVKHAKQT